MERSEHAVIKTSVHRGALGAANNKPLKRLNESHVDLATALRRGINDISIPLQQLGD